MENNSRVMIIDAAYEADVMALAVEAIFAAFPLDVAGKTVLVKPNMLSGHDPEKAVTTHPVLVTAVVEKLLKAGARVMVGDNPGVFGYGRSEQAARISGIRPAAGDCFVNLSANPVRHALSSRMIDHVVIAKEVLSADVVISLPKLKTHGLTFFTGAVKNTFGYVVGGDKMRVHADAPTPEKFAEALVDIYAVRPPDLTIMDAVVAMEGNGPSSGTPRAVGKLLAGRNAVSLDAAAVTLIGGKPARIPHLRIAAEKGLGIIDMARIPVNTAIIPVIDFKMPVTFLPGIMGVVLNRILSRRLNCTPEILEAACKQCGACARHCPVGAMTLKEGEFPRADKAACIHCYCCQEMCPEHAIVLKGRVMNFLRRHDIH
ncbi:MAG: DUF362 domain-containing protein [Thermodesulfobacteriota bacterium]